MEDDKGLDPHKVYMSIKTEDGKIKLIEYTDGATFSNGKRDCPNCKSEMERVPISQPYIRVNGGKILVDVNKDNIMILNKSKETDYLWGCKNKKCPKALSISSKR